METGEIVGEFIGFESKAFFFRAIVIFSMMWYYLNNQRKERLFMLTFVCYSRCTTCQKAQKWLDEKGISYEFRDIKENNPTFEELSEWYRTAGVPLRKFFNTSGLLYKSMELKDKLPAMTDEEMLRLLATDGMLVKRPLAVGDDFVLVGFKEAEWAGKLK